MFKSYTDIKTTIIQYLDDNKYDIAKRSLIYAEENHNGLRKDGKTPEFQHQLEIVFYLLSLKLHKDVEEEVLTAAFLHDVLEDKDITDIEMQSIFGEKITEIVKNLSKKVNGVKKSNTEYWGTLSVCPLSVLVKGGDRIQNFNSMVGVFSIEKQKNYIKDGECSIIPMIEQAITTFPEYKEHYHNILMYLKMQVYMIKHSFKD